MNPRIPAPLTVERGLCFLWLALCVSGCSSGSRQEQLQRVLSADPGFADVLQQHRLLLARHQALERELDLKRLMADQAIGQIRQDVAATELGIRRKQAALKETLSPARSILEEDLGRTVQEIRQRQHQRAQASKILTRIQKSLKALGPPEPDELVQARRQMQRLEAEVDILKAHRDLVERKLQLLEL